MHTIGIFAVGLIFGALACAPAQHTGLTTDERRQCAAGGGYESRGGFGEPICQIDFPDGGKSCRGKADCKGLCISEPPERIPTVTRGTAVAGKCARAQSIFGCYGVVENGKLVDGYICVD